MGVAARWSRYSRVKCSNFQTLANSNGNSETATEDRSSRDGSGMGCVSQRAGVVGDSGGKPGRLRRRAGAVFLFWRRRGVKRRSACTAQANGGSVSDGERTRWIFRREDEQRNRATPCRRADSCSSEIWAEVEVITGTGKINTLLQHRASAATARALSKQ